MRMIPTGLAGLLLLGLAACSGQAAVDKPVAPETIRAALTGDVATKDALVRLYGEAIASKEPGPTVYIASVPEELKPLTDAFARAFPGLRADYQRYIGDKLAARLDGEYASGKHSGDIVLVSTLELRALGKTGRLQPLALPSPDIVDAQYRDPDGRFVSVYKKAFTVAYNPKLVPDAQVPQTVQQALDPRWQGRYTFPSAGNVAGGTGDTPMAILTASGRATDADVAKLYGDGVAGPPSSELLPAVAQGRYAFALWVNAAAVQAQVDRGAPLKLAFPPKLAFLANVTAGVLDKAPHPVSSRLFIAWLLTPAAQKILADLNFYGTAKGAPVPNGYPAADRFLNAGQPEDEAWADRLQSFHQHRLALTK